MFLSVDLYIFLNIAMFVHKIPYIQILQNVVKYNEAFRKKEHFILPSDFLQECFAETMKLILRIIGQSLSV